MLVDDAIEVRDVGVEVCRLLVVAVETVVGSNRDVTGSNEAFDDHDEDTDDTDDEVDDVDEREAPFGMLFLSCPLIVHLLVHVLAVPSAAELASVL